MVGWNAGQANGRTILDLAASSAGRGSRATRTRARDRRARDARARSSATPRAAARLPLLVAACATVGGLQIQNRGTLGGNIANASPAGDSFPPLAVYEAVVEVARRRAGRRRVPFASIFAGVKKTTLRPGELIEAIQRADPARGPRGSSGARSGRARRRRSRRRWPRACSGSAATARSSELRFALGSMAPTVRRLAKAEAFVQGKRLTREVVHEACALVAQDVSPIDDIRSTAEYRLAVSQNLLASFLTRET